MTYIKSMVTYVNTHPNPIHIVVDGSLRLIGVGEKFDSKAPLTYEYVEPVLKTPKQKKKKIDNGNS